MKVQVIKDITKDGKDYYYLEITIGDIPFKNRIYLDLIDIDYLTLKGIKIIERK